MPGPIMNAIMDHVTKYPSGRTQFYRNWASAYEKEEWIIEAELAKASRNGLETFSVKKAFRFMTKEILAQPIINLHKKQTDAKDPHQADVLTKKNSSKERLDTPPKYAEDLEEPPSYEATLKHGRVENTCDKHLG